MTIHGIPSSQPNPEFKLEKFKTFVPRYANYVDAENGVISTLVNSLTATQSLVGVSNAKVVFSNVSLPKDLTVLNVDSANDIILGKDNSCYRTGYELNSNITILNNEIVDVDIKIKYFLNGLDLFSKPITLTVGSNEIAVIDENLSTGTAGSVLTVEIENLTLSDLDLTVFGNNVESNFVAANGPGSTLYELFCNISDNKILKDIWNTDWEFAFSYCIAHYLDLVNRETNRSFGLDVQAKESTPRPLVSRIDKVDYDYSTTMLSHQYAKFWQSTEFGRVLIVLLQTKGVPSMLVVGAVGVRGVNNGR